MNTNGFTLHHLANGREIWCKEIGVGFYRCVELRNWEEPRENVHYNLLCSGYVCQEQIYTDDGNITPDMVRFFDLYTKVAGIGNVDTALFHVIYFSNQCMDNLTTILIRNGDAETLLEKELNSSYFKMTDDYQYLMQISPSVYLIVEAGEINDNVSCIRSGRIYLDDYRDENREYTEDAKSSICSYYPDMESFMEAYKNPEEQAQIAAEIFFEDIPTEELKHRIVANSKLASGLMTEISRMQRFSSLKEIKSDLIVKRSEIF